MCESDFIDYDATAHKQWNINKVGGPVILIILHAKQ
jgi:hypothetical protein